MNDLERLAEANADMRRRDPELDAAPPLDGDGGVAVEMAGRPNLATETVVRRKGRPVLTVRRDEADLDFDDPQSEMWKARLGAARGPLMGAARSVGRIEVEGHPLAWLGTGWLVAPDVVVTNRHVAAEFGRRDGTRFVFRQGLRSAPMTASIDLLEEIGREESFAFELQQILHIEDAEGPDIAFLRVAERDGVSHPDPIQLAETSQVGDFVAVIGYPARDSRMPDLALMDEIFGDVYDKKRLAPGQLIEPERGTVRHDCSTLGGNSGSVVVSLDTGKAVGLHFAGRFLEANFAVASSVVGERLEEVRTGRPARRGESTTGPDRPPPEPQPAPAGGVVTRTYLLPLTVTVDLGTPSLVTDAGGPHPGPAPVLPVDSADDDVVVIEAVPEDYRDREGYDDAFLGADLIVPLPEVTAAAGDLLTYELDGQEETVLRYEHFSLVMSAGRRMCRYSAVNIDGRDEKRFARTAWRSDPRIPPGAQIKNECYGNPPRFARGHMTRREDPIWGSDAAASRGNSDSMHVTNAVPQMQPFNAGIWLDLEDYALQNARRDDIRVSVFTGPFFEADDPMRYGVQIPVEFWKVIAFVHDETRQLCATGYTMSQRDFLTEEEFVYGAHETAQWSIASIEARAGISFGPLAELDPFVEPEGFAPPTLTQVSEIQLIRRR